MTLRISTDEQYKRFENFLNSSKVPEAIQSISFSTPVLVQVITYHLYNEYMIENWINHKFGNGKEIFKEVNISTVSKLKFAINMGLPKEIYNAAKLLNTIRNKLAHDINSKPINDEMLNKLIESSDAIDPTKNTYSSLYPYQKDIIEKLDAEDALKHKLHIILSSLSLQIWNFIFRDMSRSTSEPYVVPK